MSKIQGKSVLLRVRVDFELPRVRVIRVGLYNFLSYSAFSWHSTSCEISNAIRETNKIKLKLFFFYIKKYLGN